MNRIDRLLGIVTFLQTKKYVQAEKIAVKFDISIRTVYRDIKALSELGIPVSFENSKGYFLVQGYFLPPVSFTNEEANALLLTEALVYGFADRNTAAERVSLSDITQWPYDKPGFLICMDVDGFKAGLVRA
jgi:predicted DNA-binding transcriptional regulator YafY